MKTTDSHIIRLWFGAHTPIRKYRIQYNPILWAICLRVNENFSPPSGATSLLAYSRTDRASFAKAVQQELNRTESVDSPHQAAT